VLYYAPSIQDDIKAEHKHSWQAAAQLQFLKYKSENKEEAQFSETRETRKLREIAPWDGY
jgi:hypothetical protein